MDTSNIQNHVYILFINMYGYFKYTVQIIAPSVNVLCIYICKHSQKEIIIFTKTMQYYVKTSVFNTILLTNKLTSAVTRFNSSMVSKQIT